MQNIFLGTHMRNSVLWFKFGTITCLKRNVQLFASKDEYIALILLKKYV